MARVSALLAVVVAAVSYHVATASKPNILMIVADDLGYDDLGHDSVLGNSGKTHTPAINALIDDGIAFHEYYTFKVCSPTRASLLTGRYPFNAGFYDMSEDGNHCTAQFKLLPALLKEQGYSTHALGKWDVGDIVSKCTPTYSGFDSFLGYYEACLSDYWYHWSPEQCDQKGPYVDLSNSTGTDKIASAAAGLNGTYNAHIFTAEAIRLIKASASQPPASAQPFFVYLAYQNVHLACGGKPRSVSVETGKDHGIQAPCGTVDLYGTQAADSAKAQGAVVTELDYGVGNVTAAIKSAGLWDNTVVFLVPDNGAQLDHGFNAPLRGGKHTFWEGGVRVAAFLVSGLLPASRAGTVFNGIAHSSDWYVTLVEGIAGGNATSPTTGPIRPDGLNLWPAIQGGTASPRLEVVHQVNNSYYDAFTGKSYAVGPDGTRVVVSQGNGDGSLGVAIRVGQWKLIMGQTGDQRTLAFPTANATVTPFGQSGGLHEAGTDHCRAKSTNGGGSGQTGTFLFDLSTDLGETNNLAGDPAHAGTIASLKQRLDAVGALGPPPAYEFPEPDAFQSAVGNLCRVTEKTGYLQPGDLFPTPPPSGPSPPPPSPPGPPAPPGPAQHECAAAGGILRASGSEANKVCCAAECGSCGGKDCGALPGGNANCCSNAIVASGRKCTVDKAPCVIV